MPRVQNFGFDDPIPAQVKQEKWLTIQQLLAHWPWEGLGSYTLSLSPVCARAAQRPAASCRLSTPGAGIGTTLRLSLGGWRIRFLRAPVSRKICGLLMLLVLGVIEGRRSSPDWPVNFPGAPLFSSLIGFRSAVGWGIKDQLKSALGVCGLLTAWLARVDSQIRVTQAPAVNGLTFIPTAHAIFLYSCNHL